jgi:hypothetical protein
MSSGFADPSRRGARDLWRALFAEAERRMRRRRRRQLVPVVVLLAIGAVVVLLAGGGGGGSAAAQTVRSQLAARLRVTEAEVHNSLNPLGATPDLRQLMANFAVLRRPQTAADRSWHPHCDCAGSATQLNHLTRFAMTLPHGYRVFLDVERFIAGGQLNTPGGSYMMNLDLVDRYGNVDSTSFGANTQYTVHPISTADPGPPSALQSGAGFASVVPDGVAKVSWTFGCPRGDRPSNGIKAGPSRTVVVPVINNVAAVWLTKAPAACPESTNVVWLGADGHTVASFSNDGGNLLAPPFVKGRLGHGKLRLLTSSGVGNAHIGTSSTSALAVLDQQFGSPTDRNVLVHGCVSDRETVWTSPALAVPLTVFTDHGHFVGYQYGASGGNPGDGPGAVLETSGGLTLGDEIRTLRRIYPTGYASQSSPYVGYWSVSSAGSRFYGSASPDRYPGRTVAPADRISTIGAGSFPTCSTLTRPRRFPALIKPGPHASPQSSARYYLAEADQHTRQDGACVVSKTAVPQTEPGAPSPALLAELAVLRRPGTASDTLPRALRGNSPQGRFVRYIRLARTVDGLSYYIVPSSSPSGFTGAPTARCIAASSTALHAEARKPEFRSWWAF